MTRGEGRREEERGTPPPPPLQYDIRRSLIRETVWQRNMFMGRGWRILVFAFTTVGEFRTALLVLLLSSSSSSVQVPFLPPPPP